MAEHLGPLGGLVRLPCASQIQTSRDPRYLVRTSVEGEARAQMLDRPRPRVWSISAEVEDPGAIDVVEAFALGLYGRGPWVYVPADAARLNVLTPSQSALTNMGAEFAHAGPVVIEGHPFPVSLTASIPNSWRGLVDVPVVEGLPVTVSVWVQAASGAPIISAAFYIGTMQQDPVSVTGVSGGRWQRLTWSGVAPAGASQIRLGVRSSVTSVAGPQVTWTPRPVPYAMGRGASSVIVESAGSTPVFLAGPYSDGQWIVREVGNAGW